MGVPAWGFIGGAINLARHIPRRCPSRVATFWHASISENLQDFSLFYHKILDFLRVEDDGNIDLSRDSNREVLPKGEGVKDGTSLADVGITVNGTRGIPCPQSTAGQPTTMAPGRTPIASRVHPLTCSYSPPH